MVDKVLSRAEEDIEFLTVGAETKERVIQFIFKIRPHQRKYHLALKPQHL